MRGTFVLYLQRDIHDCRFAECVPVYRQRVIEKEVLTIDYLQTTEFVHHSLAPKMF